MQIFYVSSFMFTCLADLFDAIANQNFWAHEAYPDGRYECRYLVNFPAGPTVFSLDLVKVDAPNWDFTFSDIEYDLVAIFDAAQHFGISEQGLPQMHIEVLRYRNGVGGPTFLTSQGGISFGTVTTANTSVA